MSAVKFPYYVPSRDINLLINKRITDTHCSRNNGKLRDKLAYRKKCHMKNEHSDQAFSKKNFLGVDSTLWNKRKLVFDVDRSSKKKNVQQHRVEFTALRFTIFEQTTVIISIIFDICRQI